MTLGVKTQRIASALWPLTLLALVIVIPFAVKKAYDEKRAAGEI
jgi:hypothetical protein